MESDNIPTGLLARNSSFINCETLHIHPTSDIFDPTKNYVALVSYLTGNIFIKHSDWIINNIPQRRRRRTGNYLHGRLFYFVYGHWKMQNTTFIGGGFSYLDGTWKFISRTLNTMNNERRLNKFEETLIQVVMDNLYINHRWLEMPSDHRINCQSLAAMERNKNYISRVHPSNIEMNRKLHGTIKWLPNQQYRLGFIECIGLDTEIYIHSANIINYRSFPYSSKNVEFNIRQKGEGWKAENIVMVWP
jgi:hypothetical protein